MKFCFFIFILLNFSLFGEIDDALKASSVKRPAPQNNLVWRTDLEKSLFEAQLKNRPLFVTFRCLPCKQCSSFDKGVLEGGPELSPLLKEFITVRLTDAAQLNSTIFNFEGYQDLDLSWWGYLLSPKGQIYGVFGGKDHISDATRISIPALQNTLTRVLNHHYQPDRKSWKVDGPEPVLSQGKAPKDYPMFDDWTKENPWFAKQTCIHCHQVNDILRFAPIKLGKFDKKKDLDMWPLPENTGIEVDLDHGLKVKSLVEDRPVKHSLKVGDELVAAGNRLLFSQADFRAVLHRFTDKGILDVWVKRDGQIIKSALVLNENWKQPLKEEHLYWRKSVYDGPISSGPGFFPLKGPKTGKGSMSIKPYFGKNFKDRPAYIAGIRPNHVIVAVNGKSPDLVGRTFIGWFKLNFSPGETVTYTVMEKGKRKDFKFTLKK
ncbi:MAG: thioredoxin family protein [Lentisphaeraceae bacterium]|nr:thioredoxin family protein [Lentisphaeraceae bacterium]